MLDPLPFCVLSESMPIPMLGGAEHPLFAGIKLFLSFLFSGDQAFPLQGPCAVNPLRAVPRRRKVVKVPAKLSGRGVVLCVSIAFLVEPPNHTSFFGGRVLRVVGTS